MTSNAVRGPTPCRPDGPGLGDADPKHPRLHVVVKAERNDRAPFELGN